MLEGSIKIAGISGRRKLDQLIRSCFAHNSFRCIRSITTADDSLLCQIEVTSLVMASSRRDEDRLSLEGGSQVIVVLPHR